MNHVGPRVSFNAGGAVLREQCPRAECGSLLAVQVTRRHAVSPASPLTRLPQVRTTTTAAPAARLRTLSTGSARPRRSRETSPS